MPDLKALRPFLGDPRQYASVRGITLDDGAERGQCALLFSTGGGLDFMVLTDRQMDIASLSLAGRQLGWQSPAGFVAPQLLSAEGDSAKGFDRGFSGFLVTCGLDHIGHPVPGHPHHGKLPYTPARLTAVGEDWAAGVLYAEGQSRQVRYGAEMLALTRRIEAAIGGTSLTIRDRIENLGPTAQPVELMYHFNLGHPAITTGGEITLDGAPTTGPLTLPTPTGPGAATFHPVGHTGTAQCMITGQGVTTHLTFNGAELPCLQLCTTCAPGSPSSRSSRGISFQTPPRRPSPRARPSPSPRRSTSAPVRLWLTRRGEYLSSAPPGIPGFVPRQIRTRLLAGWQARSAPARQPRPD